MNRQNLLGLLASLPLCGWMRPKAVGINPDDLDVRITQSPIDGRLLVTTTLRQHGGEILSHTMLLDDIPAICVDHTTYEFIPDAEPVA